MQANWNWGIFFEQAPFGNVTYFSWLVDGFLTTVALSVCAWILAFLLGSFFGILRTLPNKILSNIGAAYVTIFRNIPLIVQFFIWYLAAPDLLPYKASIWFKAELNPNIQFLSFPPARWVSLPERASVSRSGLAFRPSRAGNATQPWPLASRCRKPIVTFCCPMPTALSFRR